MKRACSGARWRLNGADARLKRGSWIKDRRVACGRIPAAPAARVQHPPRRWQPGFCSAAARVLQKAPSLPPARDAAAAAAAPVSAFQTTTTTTTTRWTSSRPRSTSVIGKACLPFLRFLGTRFLLCSLVRVELGDQAMHVSATRASSNQSAETTRATGNGNTRSTGPCPLLPPSVYLHLGLSLPRG